MKKKHNEERETFTDYVVFTAKLAAIAAINLALFALMCYAQLR